MFPHIVYGGDYNPEQWSPETWQEDARLMQEAGVNLVSLGIFAWAKMQPAADTYDFSWLDQIMDLLHKHGVRVNLATPTASPPPWLVHRYPEILPVTADGVKLWHGSRRHYCPHSPAYRESARELVTRLAKHMRGHPALALWHVDNEYACHISECFCDASIAAFREWLQKRYGTLDAFNEAWGTAFWSQQYSDWEQVMPPMPTPAQVNPTQKLDWKRFCSDSWLECFEDQKAILREITPEIPITTNFMRFHQPLDYWKWAASEDIVSLDSYPDISDPKWMVDTGMVLDLIRSLRSGQPWLLMEQATTYVNWREKNVTKRPGVMRLGSYQALARGATGIMFFQWRASKAGSEKFHSAIVPHVGIDSRVWREAKALGAELQKLDALLASRVQSEVAILFDWENWWALESGDKPANDFKLLPRVAEIYAEFFRRNITVDFAYPDSDLSKYRLVIAPHLYLVSERAVQNIEQYAENGGTLLMNFFSGIVDEHEHIWLGGYPAPFRKILGMWVEEFVPYSPIQTNQIEEKDGRRFACKYWSDVIRLEGAEALAHYCEDYFTQTPAVTRHHFGNGLSYYLGTSLNREGLSWLIDQICVDAGLLYSHDLPEGVEITRRSDGTHDWFFILNYAEEDVKVTLPANGVNLITGLEAKQSLQLGPNEIAVIQTAQK
ncbi:MAG TPA: beta-galactosidase [Anaerolineales bacterium]|nr:beta-galactosidase [Anaerolineales bacterium]